MNKIDDKTYNLIKQLMPIPCVDLIVYIDKRILLCKRNNSPAKDEWWIPGGRILKNETLEHAVHRKAKEELNIDVVIEKQVGTYDNIFEEVHTPATVYLVRPTQQDFVVTIDSQHREYRFIASLDELSLNPILRQEITDSEVFK